MSAHTQRIGTNLTKDLGFTNARWQTLGELSASPDLLTVSQLARRMGLSRQAIQRLIDSMAADGLVTFVDNPRNQRAMHIVLTSYGQQSYYQSLEREWQWTNMIAEGFESTEIEQAVHLIEALTQKMEQES